ncbi:hypothetical protein PCANC_07478 [Puccinia coronata f. sp. avenae]|uniref:DAGKc domain-containing protein n=1 Tax=Puccinia coronata f. sp. avenae TaxID=200324 RepID=A0A2N5VFQ0_9BASI|nr:hypothetical protein PCASD_02831 [Puccinia coronata f. sp. avenae]PLW53241.1 hypothetical protein PCANC_07478 [Puccinia coronata f. sp. avenae]
MKNERDYLLYVLPVPRSEPEPEPAPVEGRPQQPGGLCWLTFPERPSAADRAAADGEAAAVAASQSGAADEEVPKFFTAPPSHQTLNIVRENFVPFLQPQHPSQGDHRWLVIWNDHAGRRLAKKWLVAVILPILHLVGIPPSDLQVFESRQNGWEDYLVKSTHPKRSTKVIILGGDGTISDFINQAQDSLQERKRLDLDDGSNPIKMDLIILPFGTANAMFFNAHPTVKELDRPKDILTGLLNALLEPTRMADGLPEPSPSRLTLASVETLDHTNTLVQGSVSFVVTSTALHASILDTANQLVLQPDYQPTGTEVFKQAFLKSVAQTWKASVTLLPSAQDGLIQRYDPSIETLVPVRMDAQDANAREVRLEGPFSYFTACLVDRLESKFMIAPLRNPVRFPLSDESTRSSTIDVIIIRPTRDPGLKLLLEDAHSSSQLRADALTNFIGVVMQAAYQDGLHINLLANDRLPIVEYYRCGGWTWSPTDEDLKHQVCIDGKVLEIPGNGGSVKCTILSPDQTDIRIY